MIHDEACDDELLQHAPPQDIIPENGFQVKEERHPKLSPSVVKIPENFFEFEEESPCEPNSKHGFRLQEERLPVLDSYLETSEGACGFSWVATSGTCPKCKKEYERLDRHMLTHTGERPYTCKRCPERFRQRIHLLRHLNRHNKKKSSFPCTYCDKVLSRKDKLREHMAKSCRVLREK